MASRDGGQGLRPRDGGLTGKKKTNTLILLVLRHRNAVDYNNVGNGNTEPCDRASMLGRSVVVTW